MKNALISQIFNVLLALMLFRGLTAPQSVAVNFVAAWALFECLVCIVISLAGVAAYDHWLRNRHKSGSLNDRDMKIFRAVFCREPSALSTFWSLMIFAGTFACLAGAGWIFTALLYVMCVQIFRAVRTSYRQRIEEAGLCPDLL
ncbi:DNZ54_00345 family protein [Vagococcus sp. WN89Y]|uniref:DNZ54_00345 family protein n=1 Tax=Vagococcus sp. WN89Y TaxID=3457258 RepID=UPI003FCCA14D